MSIEYYASVATTEHLVRHPPNSYWYIGPYPDGDDTDAILFGEHFPSSEEIQEDENEAWDQLAKAVSKIPYFSGELEPKWVAEGPLDNPSASLVGGEELPPQVEIDIENLPWSEE